MSSPETPGDFVPPRVDVKQPPSCWVIGGVGCLIVFILSIIAMAVFFVNFTNSKTGKDLMKGFGTIVQNSEKMQPCRIKMTDIHGALVRYQLKTGNYPKSLTDLYPDYLPNRSDLHCDLDTNPDPNHVSFTYVQPTADAPQSTTFLTLKWDNPLVISGVKQDIVEELTENIAGQFTMNQFQNGKLIMTQTVTPQ